MHLWDIIKKYIHETEIANNIAFGDTAWQRFKRMEAEIDQWAEKAYGQPPQVYQDEPQEVRDLFGGFDLMPDDPGHVKHWDERGYRCHVFKMPSTFGQYSWGITEIRGGQGAGGFSETFEKAIEDAQAAIDEQTARSMKP